MVSEACILRAGYQHLNARYVHYSSILFVPYLTLLVVTQFGEDGARGVEAVAHGV